MTTSPYVKYAYTCVCVCACIGANLVYARTAFTSFSVSRLVKTSENLRLSAAVHVCK